MAATRINVDVVPELARPEPVGVVLTEAVELRDKLRHANEELAQLQRQLDEQEAADVARAAERIRSGESPGTISAGIAKSRSGIETQKRAVSALQLASAACVDDLVTTLHDSAPSWIATLHDERQRQVEQALAALDAFEAACTAISDASGAADWLQSSVRDGTFAQRIAGSGAAFVAPSSARASTSSAPFNVSQLAAWAREAVEPPPPKPTAMLRVAERGAA